MILLKKKWSSTVNDDPWADLGTPHVEDSINAKRVDANSPWNVFWGRTIDGACLLLFNYSAGSEPRHSLPALKGLEITTPARTGIDDRHLIFTLTDPGKRDLFFTLCKDILSAISTAETENEAINLALSRTWRWHHLLRGGSGRRLSPSEQKGLIGELIVLQRHILPLLSASDAVASWQGPLDGPKDFELGQLAVEVKARRGTATPYIEISSENQLAIPELSTLFLLVVNLDGAPSDSPEAQCVTDFANALKLDISNRDEGAIELFESRLAASGFLWTDDYSDVAWIEGENRLLSVCGRFPRITPASLPLGVNRVRYSISLQECEPFLVEFDSLSRAITRLDND